MLGSLHKRLLSTTPTPRSVPVAIVGGGPVGVYLSALLSRYGVKSLVLEQQENIHVTNARTHPRAHVLHTRSMELLRALDVEEQVWSQAPPVDHWKHFYYGHSLLGRQFAYVDHFEGPDYKTLRDASPSRVTQFSQPSLERILYHRAIELGESVGAEIIHNATCKRFEQDAATSSVLVEYQSSDGALHQISCDSLVAADGAYSPIRRSLGVDVSGERNLESFMSVHLTCKPLARRLLDHNRSAMLSFVFNEDVIGVVVGHDLRQGSFVVHLPFFPPVQQPEHFSPEVCRQLLSKCFGAPLAPLDGTPTQPGDMPWEFHSAKPWGMHATWADEMTRGNVHLVGDAAHQFPPSGGFGVNTGLGDAHNLAWKLALQHHGVAKVGPGGERITDTYQQERLPVVKSAVNLAIDNYRRGLIPSQALGLNRVSMSGFLDNLVRATKQVSTDTRKQVFEGCVKAGTVFMNLYSSAASPVARYLPSVESRVEKLRRIVEDDKEALPLLFPRNDLGYRYSQGACVNVDSADSVHPEASKLNTEESIAAIPEKGTTRHSTRGSQGYEPSSLPGRLLPHIWLDQDGKHVSSIDLVDTSAQTTMPVFTVFVKGDHDLSTETETTPIVQVPVRLVFVHSTDNGINTDSSPRLPEHIHVVDRFGDWDMDSIVVVRPDGHVCYTSSSATWRTVKSVLESAAFVRRQGH